MYSTRTDYDGVSAITAFFSRRCRDSSVCFRVVVVAALAAQYYTCDRCRRSGSRYPGKGGKQVSEKEREREPGQTHG